MHVLRRTGWLAFVVGGAACGQVVGIEPLVSDVQIDASVPEAQDSQPPVVAPSDAGVEADAYRGPAPKRVFVTSRTWPGDLGGRRGADEHCTTAALLGGLTGGPWIAWIATESGPAIDGVTDSAYVLLDGRPVVTGKKQLASGNLTVPINITESDASTASGNVVVWTGTFANGEAGDRCGDWSTSGGFSVGTAGSLDRATDGGWNDNGGAGVPLRSWPCNTKARLYCFER